MHVLTNVTPWIATVRVLKVTGIRLTIRALVTYVGILAVVQGRELNTAARKTDEERPHP